MTDLAERRGMETDVYRPAEDSHLLLQAVLDHVDTEDLVLEVGTGSGYVAAELTAETGATVVGSDVNPAACREAREHGVEAVRGDLVEPFGDETFDVVVFNPPYLPEHDAAERDDWMEVALTGGETGREVIQAFVETVDRVLAPGGSVFMLASSLSGLDEIEDLAARMGFVTETVASDSFPFETIVVFRLMPPSESG